MSSLEDLFSSSNTTPSTPPIPSNISSTPPLSPKKESSTLSVSLPTESKKESSTLSVSLPAESKKKDYIENNDVSVSSDTVEDEKSEKGGKFSGVKKTVEDLKEKVVNNKKTTGLIVGISIGVIVVIILIILGVVLYNRNKNKDDTDSKDT